MPDIDPYYKKTITYPYRGQKLTFRVAQDLFSSQGVDVGTQRLLRSIIDPQFDAYRKVLDLGCGYGPIGLTLEKIQPARIVHLVDRDALALEYSRENARLNRVSDHNIYGSLGYSDVLENDFDLILSNIPAKAGQPVITSLLLDAANHLRQDGLVGVVVVTPLEEIVTKMLSDPQIQIVFTKRWPGHTVYHYVFLDEFKATPPVPPEVPLDLRVYGRERTRVELLHHNFDIQTVYGIPEFGSLHFRTELVLDTLSSHNFGQSPKIAVHNPGQGYVPVAAQKVLSPQSIDLVDRDLLALRISRLNLTNNGFESEKIELKHQVGAQLGNGKQVDLFVLLLRDDEGLGVHSYLLANAMDHLNPNGTVLVAVSVTAMRRLEGTLRGAKRARVVDRLGKRGYEVAAIKRG